MTEPAATSYSVHIEQGVGDLEFRVMGVSLDTMTDRASVAWALRRLADMLESSETEMNPVLLN
jgi:hypothetical protein